MTKIIELAHNLGEEIAKNIRSRYVEKVLRYWDEYKKIYK